MALSQKIKTAFGDERLTYIRLNNVEVSNHGIPCVATFRAFVDQAAFKDGARFVEEYTVEFDADVSKALWPQAYAALIKEKKFAKKEI